MRILAMVFLLATLGAAPATKLAALGSAAPSLPVVTLDGRPLRGEHSAGKITVINFWATWCPPCRAETPDMVAAYARLHGAGVDFLGIDTTETAPIVKTFLSAKGVPYPVALAGPAVYNAYGIAYIPTTIVLDAHGIVRARWVGEIKPDQLARYVAAARAGQSATFRSPIQARIDALLAPSVATSGGDAAARLRAVNRAIAGAEALAQAHDGDVDYERIERAEGHLLVNAGAALRDAASTPAQRILGLNAIARGSGDLNRWQDAVAADRAALAITPGAAPTVAALSRAYYRLHDYPDMIAQARRYTQLRPDDGDGWADLGLANQRARSFGAAAAAYDVALARLTAAARREPSADAFADVADTSLDAADVAVSLGDSASAKRNFARANAYGARLSATGPYATLKRNITERTQEGLVAVALARGTSKTVVSVVRWTGPDLPGSLASTLKYRLIVAAPAAANVTLRAQGLRPAWVASFCADGLCSPQTVSFTSPAAGVKTYEFQLIPPHDGDQPGHVAIAVGGGGAIAIPETSAH